MTSILLWSEIVETLDKKPPSAQGKMRNKCFDPVGAFDKEEVWKQDQGERRLTERDKAYLVAYISVAEAIRIPTRGIKFWPGRRLYLDRSVMAQHLYKNWVKISDRHFEITGRGTRNLQEWYTKKDIQWNAFTEEAQKLLKIAIGKISGT